MTATVNAEFLSKGEIQDLQEKKFAEMMEYISLHSPFYKNLFKENKIDYKKITLENLPEIPFTTKDDLAHHNDNFLCVDKNSIVDFTTTSGTVGEPVVFYLTEKDLDRLAYNEAISLQCAGGNEKDIYQLMTTIDKQFMAGLAYYLGIRKMKAGVIRVGPGTPFTQWDSIKRFSPTTLIAIPSFIPKLLTYAHEHHIDFKNCSVKNIVCIGEPVRNPDFTFNELGKRIVSQWDVKLFSTYASTEMSAAFTECEAGRGGHHHPELLILEVLDANGKPVDDGQLGEVVVTTLGVEGMPLLRYKTGDLCHVHYSKCECGRSTARLGPVVGRKQQMIKYKGTTLFPQAIFDVIDKVKEIELYQVEISKDEFENDQITIVLSSEMMSHGIEANLKALFKSKLRVTPHFRLISTQQLHSRIFNDDKRKSQKIIYI